MAGKRATREPDYIFTWEEVATRGSVAASFAERRMRQQKVLAACDSHLLPRIFNIDHNAYLEGALTSKHKELQGLVASLVLRCDDCIFYHIIQAYRLGATQSEIAETLDVGAVIAGTITIPHLRRAAELLVELYPAS